jgi:non-ribosomal peptide synthetase component F
MTNRAVNPFAGASSLVEVLRRRAVDQPDRLAYRFLGYGEEKEAEETTLTYAELERRARGIAAWLQERGAAGERVLLLYPASLDYVAAFYGCLLAGHPRHRGRCAGASGADDGGGFRQPGTAHRGPPRSGGDDVADDR